MDSTRNAGNGHNHSSSHEKRRRRKTMSSTLSARLNPDFDPRDMVRQETCLLSNSIVRKTQNNDELDPKTMCFDELVNLLHPSFISDHLQKVLHFFKTDKSELCFPNIAPFKEAFLVKIVEDNGHLKCSGFNEISRIVAKQILEVIYLNKTVFKWTHSYESGRVARNTPTPNSSSLTSSLEDLHLSHSETRQGIPTSFKVETLNTTLKFMKDKTRTKLEYPEMPLRQAEYLYSFIYPAYRETDAGFGFKSLCAPLYDCLKALEDEYDFVINFLETCNVETARISLHKVPKASIAANESWRKRDLNTSNGSSGSRDSRMSKTQREIAAKRKVVEAVSEAFKINALQDVLDFICEDKRASLDFRNVGVKESRFLELITSISRREDLHHLFSSECAVTLRRISRSYRREYWKMQVDVGKLDKRNKQRTFTMFKVPTEKGLVAKSRGEASSQSRNATDSETDTRRGISKDRRGEASSQSRNATDSETDTRRGISKDRRAEAIRQSRNATNSETDTRRGISRDRRNQPPRGRSIAFHSAGDASAELVTVSVQPPAPPRGRRGKLVEAMSIPLASDVAERMMRRMGWEGGALGARGDGITEPLMPALHIAPGAGFGHVKQVKQPSTQRSASEFRLLFLQHLLTFIQCDQGETTLSFQEPLSERDTRFVTPALAAFNERKNIGLGRENETRLVRQIVEELMRGDLAVEHEISADRKLIHLRKTVAAPNPNTPKKRKRPSKPSDCDLSVCSSTDSHTSTKSAKMRALKFLYLEKIKEFLSAEESRKEISFECGLSLKIRAYVQNVIANVNKRAIVNFNTQRENDLYVDIRRSAADCYLTVEFYAQKIILQKKYYQKRFTNSALDLPPPKSKDIDNTVIYINNVPHHNGCVRNDDNDDISDDDDDVIMIDDNNMDVIVLTDSEEAYDRQERKPGHKSTDAAVNTTDPSANCTDSVTKTTNLLLKTASSFQQTMLSELSIHSDMKPELITKRNDSLHEISSALRKSDSEESMVSMKKNLYLATDLMMKSNELLQKTANSLRKSVDYGDFTDLVSKSVNIDQYPADLITTDKELRQEWSCTFGKIQNDCDFADYITKPGDLDKNSTGLLAKCKELLEDKSELPEKSIYSDSNSMAKSADPTIFVEKPADMLEKSSISICKSPDSDNDSPNLSEIATNLVAKTTDLPKEKAISLRCMESDSDIDCDGIMSKDISIDISNDSLLLDILEADNDAAIKFRNNSELERDIEDLVKVIENSDADNFVERDFSDIQIKTELNESLDLDRSEINKSIDLSSHIRKELETDNNHNVVKEDYSNPMVKVEGGILDLPVTTKEIDETYNNHNVVKEDYSNPMVKVEGGILDLPETTKQIDETYNNHNVVKEDYSNPMVKVEGGILDLPVTTKEIDETYNNMKIEHVDDLSPVSSKRSRTDSENSYTIARKIMKLENVQSVAIVPNSPDEKISVATMQALQTLISKEIDCCDFMPLLECRGVKNGGLIYSCHNEESVVWLKNVVSVASDLNLKIMETDICNKDTFKLKIKVNSLEDPGKVLRRLAQYNPALRTAYWQVIDVHTNRYFVVITVVVDGDSYKLISAANFSLFAGTDKAQFSVVWE